MTRSLTDANAPGGKTGSPRCAQMRSGGDGKLRSMEEGEFSAKVVRFVQPLSFEERHG